MYASLDHTTSSAQILLLASSTMMKKYYSRFIWQVIQLTGLVICNPVVNTRILK